MHLNSTYVTEALSPRLADAFAFDLDGTIYLGDRLLPGVVELLRYLRSSRLPHVFATNNSSRTVRHYVEKLGAMGIMVTPEQVVTSNEVAASYLLQRGLANVYIVGTDEVVAEYRRAGVAHKNNDPQAVLLTYDTSLTYEKLAEANAFLMAGVPYFATHPDRVCPSPDGPLPDCGAFAALLEASSGRAPVNLGKPSRSMAEEIRARLGSVADQRVAFVGDRLYTDVRMANENGFQAILTLTGEAAGTDAPNSDAAPDLVVGGMEDLLNHLMARAEGASS